MKAYKYYRRELRAGGRFDLFWSEADRIAHDAAMESLPRGPRSRYGVIPIPSFREGNRYDREAVAMCLRGFAPEPQWLLKWFAAGRLEGCSRWIEAPCALRID